MAGLVAVTGATGFVGATAVHRLARAGWHVRILTRRMPQNALMPDRQIEVVLGDIDNRPSLERLVAGADAILHCAGLTKALTPIEFFNVNEGGTVRLLEAAQRSAPQARLIHISSLAAREPQLSPYAASKRAGEDKLPALAGDRDWIALRPPAVYGPGDLALLPLFKAAKLGLLAYPASPGARASTIHVSDLAAAILALVETPTWRHRIIELDDGHPGGHDWAEINYVLGQCFNKHPWAVRLPRPLMAGIAQGVSLAARATRTPQILSPDKIAELYHDNWTVAGPKLDEITPWHATFGLQEGFSDTLRWYRSEALL